MTRTAALFFLSYALLSVPAAYAFQCNECHSKNPAMVRMHTAVQGRGCFGCHNIGENLMGKGLPKDLSLLMKRRATDQQCVECHGRGMAARLR